MKCVAWCCVQATADRFGLKITIVTSFKENCVLHIEPAEKKSQRVLWLSFWAEVSLRLLWFQAVLTLRACMGCLMVGMFLCWDRMCF